MFSIDIIEQFLLRLPLKSVFRFKCVSKAWNSLISEPYLKHNYQLQSQGVYACGYFYYDSIRDGELTPTAPSRFHNFKADQYSFDFMDTLGLVVASCEGLVLLIRRCHKVDANPRYYYVCDPITRKYFTLPPALGKYKFVGHGLLCEEGGHFTVVACTDAFLWYRPAVEIETYSSKTGQWEKSVIAISSQFYLGPYVAQVMGKVLYWWELFFTRILAYDPNDPKQHGKIIEFPPDELSAYRCHDISETKEGYLQYYRAADYLEIFVLNESTTTLFNTDQVIGRQRWNLIHKIDIFNHLNIWPTDNVTDSDPQRLLLYLHTDTDKLLLSYNYIHRRMIDQKYLFDIYSHTYMVFYQQPLWPLIF